MNSLPGRAEVIEILRPLVDPELNVSLVELGLVYDVKVMEEIKTVRVEMTLTSPACPLGPEILAAVTKTLKDKGFEEVKVDIVWEPKWDPHTMASDEAKDALGMW